MGQRAWKSFRRGGRGRTLALLAAGVAIAVGLAACNGGEENTADQGAYGGGATNANAQGVPVELTELNGSGVSGNALVVKGDDTVTVSFAVTGLEAGEIHPQHVNRYPSDDREVACPTSEDDTDGDGRISAAEGTAVYGPIALELLPAPTADAEGTIRFQGRFPIEASRIYNGVILINGDTVDGAFDPAIPVACGQLGK